MGDPKPLGSWGCFVCGTTIHRWHPGAKAFIPDKNYQKVYCDLSNGQILVSKCCKDCFPKIDEGHYAAAWDHNVNGWRETMREKNWPKERREKYWKHFDGVEITQVRIPA